MKTTLLEMYLINFLVKVKNDIIDTIGSRNMTYKAQQVAAIFFMVLTGTLNPHLSYLSFGSAFTKARCEHVFMNVLDTHEDEHDEGSCEV